MEVFQQAWEAQVLLLLMLLLLLQLLLQVRILTDAVDDIVTVDDFLAVSENHILEDVNKCCLALQVLFLLLKSTPTTSTQEGDSETLDRIAGAIRGRSSRIGDVVAAEMDNYEPGLYTEKVFVFVPLYS